MSNESLLNSMSISQVSGDEKICVSPASIGSMELSIQGNLGMKPLRVCKRCGKKAYCQEEVKEFKPKGNLCKVCFNAVHYARRITFKGKRIYIKVNIRTNVCSVCGRTQNENLGLQMSVHHDVYNPENVLDFTREECVYCHGAEKGKKNEL